ncbi:MAG: hypothetical protein SF069_08600 [Phycisphaerae bacterium]|nr:hypothetical protein [Phycisphaerae bacterium]
MKNTPNRRASKNAPHAGRNRRSDQRADTIDENYEQSRDIDVQSGLLMMVDIERFSGRPSRFQRKLVAKLGHGLSRSKLVSEPKEFGTICNSTGDGALLAFSGSVVERDLLDLAIKTVNTMAHDDDPSMKVGLRVGLHRGSFAVMKDPTNGNMVAIGTGPNLCQRVMGFSDAGHIVASEAFCSHWETEEGAEASAISNLFSRPFLVYAKHDFPLRVRVHIGHDPNRLNGLPAKFAKLHETELQIIMTLGEIEQQFVYKLKSNPMTFPSELSTRVSLFGYRATGGKEGVLEPTIYRFHRDEIRPAAGTTKYIVRDPPGGAQAKAFVTGHAKCINKLADPVKDWDHYVSQLGEEGLSRETVMNFSRNARAFLAFRFGRQDLGPLGVVCIDCNDPLEGIERSKLELLGEELQSHYSTLVASLWSERTR